MLANLPALGTQLVLDLPALGGLIPALERRGFEVIGPTLRAGAIVYDVLHGLDDLPAGWTADQEAGHYRLRPRGDAALFGYALGPQGWKPYLHPPEVKLFEAQSNDGLFEILSHRPAPPKRAFLGVRSCELAAMAIQDRVLLGENYSDPVYHERRRGIFVVAVNCTVAAPTCFCASLKTGPPAQAGFDLALTELTDADRHIFLAEAGSRAGAEVLAELGPAEASATLRLEADKAIKKAMNGLTRKIKTAGLRELLYDKFESARWEETAARCLACANCTMVCPTCFCTTVDDTSDITLRKAERWRKWDSCFTQSFSYIHGGSVRMSVKARFRQRVTHKFAAWVDQFGSLGCVGCGRCLTWCPVGIDVTEELQALGAEGKSA